MHPNIKNSCSLISGINIERNRKAQEKKNRKGVFCMTGRRKDFRVQQLVCSHFLCQRELPQTQLCNFAIQLLSVHRPWKNLAILLLSFPSMHGLKGPPLCFGTKLTTPHLTVKSEGVSYSEWNKRDSLYYRNTIGVQLNCTLAAVA